MEKESKLLLWQSYEKITDQTEASGDYNNFRDHETKTAPQFEGPSPVNLLISFVDDGNLNVPLSGWGINFDSRSCALLVVPLGGLKLR